VVVLHGAQMGCAVILWRVFRWRWLHVRLHWWSALVILGVRVCRRSMVGMRAPYFWERWVWRRVHRWNARRTDVVMELSQRGTWSGEPHPVQQWTANASKRKAVRP
jgi:hypothetical protein